MKRFTHILFHTDCEAGSRSALNRAAALANQNRGRLTVVNVLEELPRDLLRLAAAIPSENLELMAVEDMRERLVKFVRPIQKTGLPVELQVLCGKPSVEIIRAALRGQHDLVMMTAEGRKGFKEKLFGSTSLHLMRKCPCPVWIMKPSRHPQIARILVAVDPDPLDIVRDGVNRTIMELATSLARLEGSELHVVHAWEPWDKAVVRGWQARVPVSRVDEWIEETRVAHQRRFEELLGKFRMKDLKHRTHLVEGEAGTVIPQVAGKERIDLIIMGTLARVGLEGYFIGNTAETVLQRVACSVLTVKPSGFVSPVKLD
jgi:nucleotide-binding universal stress UspA family protein